MDEKSIRKSSLLKWHSCSEGLTDDEINTIASDCELIQVKTGEILHRAGDRLEFVYLITLGKLKEIFYDPSGNPIQHTYLMRGSQFGGVAGAQPAPIPITVVAVEPTEVLKLDYQKFLQHLASIPIFLVNFIQGVGNVFKKTLRIDRSHLQPRVVMVVHSSPSSRHLTKRLIDRLQKLGEQPCVLTDDPSWNVYEDVPHLLLVQDGRWLSDEAVRKTIVEWPMHERVFIDIAADVDRDQFIRGFKLADLILTCIQPKEWQPFYRDLYAMVALEPAWREKINAVWILDGGQMHAPRADQLHKLISSDFKISFADPPMNCGLILDHGVERIVHTLRGIRVGIALGGGAARGMAHLGVLKALEQNGIIVDMISGTSAGAMIGTIYASGLDADFAIERFNEDLTPSWLFRRMRHGSYWYLLYKYRRKQFDPMLRKYLFDLQFEQLPIPMSTITVDLVNGEAVVRDRGDAVNGIIESINLPGFSAPVCRNGQALIDGGLVNNVPADVLVAKGCNFVIAVSVTAKLEKEFADIYPDSGGSKYRTPSVMQTLMRSYVVQSFSMNKVGVQPADLTLDVDVTNFDLTDFTRTGEMATIGARTTEASLDRIRTALAEIDKELFVTRTLKQ